jgi:YaiO family outer membrane protein
MIAAARGLAAGLALLCAAASAAPLPWQVETGVGVETLDNGSPDWRQLDVALRRRFDDGATAEVALREAQRYGRTDRELALGGLWNIGPDATVSLRGTTAGAANFLPRQSVAIDATQRLLDGWVASIGLVRNRFEGIDSPSTGTTLLRLGIERYAGAWRLAGGLTQARLDGGASAMGWRLQADRYVGEAGRVGLLVAGGEELEKDPAGVISTQVNTFVLLARWPVAPGWALTGEAGSTHVSNIVRRVDGASLSLPGGYQRSGVRIGVQHEF